MTDAAVTTLAPVVGTRAACAALGEPRARYYRRHRQSPLAERPARVARPQPRALSEAERAAVLEVLHHPDHVDEAPATVYAKLLDEGRYLASTSTMYRILRANAEVRERRRQAAHPAAKKPELIAAGPNQVWSWDNNEIAGAGQVGAVLPVRGDRHLQPLRPRLDAGPRRARQTGRGAAGRHGRQARRRPGPADHPLGPGHLDGLQARGLLAGRPRRHQEPQPAPLLERQPLFGVTFPHPQVPAQLPRPLWLLRGRSWLLSTFLQVVQRRAPFSGFLVVSRDVA